MVDVAAQLLHSGLVIHGRLFGVVLKLRCITTVTITLLFPCNAQAGMRPRWKQELFIWHFTAAPWQEHGGLVTSVTGGLPMCICVTSSDAAKHGLQAATRDSKSKRKVCFSANPSLMTAMICSLTNPFVDKDNDFLFVWCTWNNLKRKATICLAHCQVGSARFYQMIGFCHEDSGNVGSFPTR